MDNPKNDEYYLTKIRTDLTFITEHMKNITENELFENEVLTDSMMFRLVQISENAKRMSNQYQYNHPDIPWQALYGLRNRIVHDYGNVDFTVVYTTLQKDIPELLKTISN